MKKEIKDFIKNTSLDYDIDYDTVLYFYKNYNDSEFYEKLEEYIKERQLLDK